MAYYINGRVFTRWVHRVHYDYQIHPCIGDDVFLTELFLTELSISVMVFPN